MRIRKKKINQSNSLTNAEVEQRTKTIDTSTLGTKSQRRDSVLTKVESLSLSSSTENANTEDPSSSPRGSLKEAKKKSIVGNFNFHFVVENTETQFYTWEYFKFSSNPNFTMGVNPFDSFNEKNPTDFYVCFCETALGPLAPNTFANTLYLHLGKDKMAEIDKIIEEEYFGEIPVNNSLVVQHGTTKIIFLVIDSEHKFAGYQALRIAMLKILESVGKTKYRSSSSHRLSKRSLQIPSIFCNLYSILSFIFSCHNVIPLKFPLFSATVLRLIFTTMPHLLSETKYCLFILAAILSVFLYNKHLLIYLYLLYSWIIFFGIKNNLSIAVEGEKSEAEPSPSTRPKSTTRVESSPQITVNKNTLTITINLLDSFKKLTKEEYIWQMAKAHRKLLFLQENQLSVGDMEKRFAQLSCFKPASVQEKQKLFNTAVKRNELIRRGVLSDQEVEWLFYWVADQSHPPMQLAATDALINYLNLPPKAILRINVSPKELLDKLFTTKDQCLKAIMDLAENGAVSLHRVIQFDQIKKEEIIGKGATATVYKAQFEGNAVAFKEFAGTAELSQFRKEVAMMSLLKHPCLVNIIGAGIIKETNNLFLVSEFVARGDLYNILHDKNKTPVANEIIVQWALDIAHGMQYLHSLGVIHRDLKSLNILVSNDNHCKIIDYGASRMVDEASKLTGNVGTVCWMAPEMFQNLSYTPKVDVYSFAIVLYELVVREQPFAGENSFSLPVQIVKGIRPKLPKSISKKWKKLITLCWHQKPSKRPAFETIIEALEEIKSESPVPNS